MNEKDVRSQPVELKTGEVLHIDFLSQKYTSGDYKGVIQSERVILQIAPGRQRTHGL